MVLQVKNNVGLMSMIYQHLEKINKLQDSEVSIKVFILNAK